MEWAFRSPSRLRERMEAAEPGSFSPAGLAALSEDRAVELFSEKPALHRYPKSMGKRAHAVAEMLVDEYDGVASAVWTTAADGSELYRRLRALPGPEQVVPFGTSLHISGRDGLGPEAQLHADAL